MIALVSMVSLPMLLFADLLEMPSVVSFLDLIAFSEGTSHKNGYYALFGGKKSFSSTHRHPHTVICRKSRGKKLYSSAAGRYQIIAPTWKRIARDYKLKDFSPFNQDIAAIALLDKCGCIGDILVGNITKALEKACHIWASLPGSPYGQPTRSLQDLLHIFGERYAYYSGVKL